MASRARGWEIRLVPLIADPPPGTATAAQGRWHASAPATAASNQADSFHGTPGADPTPPTPAVTARTVTAGVMIAAAAVVGAGFLVITLAALRLLLSGDGRLTFGGVATALLGAGYVLSAAALGLGLARYRGRRVVSGRTAVVLALAAAVIVCAGLATARTHPLKQPTTEAVPKPRTTAAAPPMDFKAHGPPFAPAGALAPTRPAPSPDVSPKAPEGPASFIRDYYTALDARRFADAWASLSPTVQRAFGGFAHWRDGYAQTVSSRPRELVVASRGDVVTVRHVLLARNRDCATTQRFGMTWTLERVSDNWRVVELRGRVLDTPPCR